MRVVKLANGKQYEADWCGAANGVLTMNLFTDESVVEIATAFSDSEATSRIEFDYEIKTDIFEGYTKLISIRVGGWTDNGVLISLVKS